MKQHSVFRTWFGRAGLTAGVSMLVMGVAQAQPVRGLYVSGQGGASFNQDQVTRLNPVFPAGRDRYHTGITGVGSVGWGLGNGFRFEVEGNYRNNRYGQFKTGMFPSTVGGRQQEYGAMANALFDMDIGKSWVYPYFGAGVGYGWQVMNTAIRAPNGAFNQHVGGTTGSFAYQGIFGLSFPVPWVVGLSATTEYRFYSMPGSHTHSSSSSGYYTGAGQQIAYSNGSGERQTRAVYNHSLLLGLRYEFNPAPPPPPPVAAVAAPPAPAPARTYLVFFDWDSATLSDRARTVVAEAAKNSSATQVTHIQVSGYTDSSAAHPGARGEAYNLALSKHRADSVKAELIRDGIAAGLITTQGFGETHPLVTTGPNTREPQNRRVEIDFK